MRSLALLSVATLTLSVAFAAASCGDEATLSGTTGSTTSASSSSEGGSGGGESSTTGTGGGDGRLLDKDCDPLVPSHCGFPFPSSVYLEDDAKTKTGKHVVFRKNTF